MKGASDRSMRRRSRSGPAFLLVGALLCLAPSACISTWRDLPDPVPEKPRYAASRDVLHYDIDISSGLFGGGTALRDTFREIAPFERLAALSEPPQRGLFCRIDYDRRSPNVASGVAAYVSYIFLFTIPFWSTEGYVVQYHLYEDGEERKIFEYEITRKSFFWILTLPFAWVNFITPSESEAFSATVYQFFQDAQPYLEAAARRPG